MKILSFIVGLIVLCVVNYFVGGALGAMFGVSGTILSFMIGVSTGMLYVLVYVLLVDL